MLHAGEQDRDFADEQVVRELVAARCPADRDIPIVRRVVYAFHARIACEWRRGRVLLAGDAAHLSPPFAGQGMNSGIRDALNLGWKLAAVSRDELGPALLDSYEAERKPHAWELIEMAMAIGRFMMPRSRASAALMQSVLQSLSVYPPARDYVMQMKFKPKPQYRSGFVLPDGAPQKVSWAGRLFIQPMVELPDSRRMLLDDALGRGFTALSFGVSDEIDWGAELGLGIRTFRIVPKDYNFPHPLPALALLRDYEGAIAAALRAHLPCTVLLRPDRYVAAILPAAKINDMSKRLAQLLQTTWGEPEAQRTSAQRPEALDSV